MRSYEEERLAQEQAQRAAWQRQQQQGYPYSAIGATGFLADAMRGLGGLGGYGYPQQGTPPRPKQQKESPKNKVEYPGPVVPPKEPERGWFLADFILFGALTIVVLLVWRML